MTENIKTEISDSQVTTIQTIVKAMVFGVGMFGGVAFFLGKDGEPGEPLIGYIAAGFAAMQLVLRSVLPNFIAKTQIQQNLKSWKSDGEKSISDKSSELFGIYQTVTIIGVALLEGAAFFALITYIITSLWWTLAVAGVLLVAMMATFPTRTRIEFWIEEQMQLIELEQ